MSELLELLKTNLCIKGNNLDKFLEHTINVSKLELRNKGIMLNQSISDNDLVICYAAFLYRKRAGDSTTIPRILEYKIRNRIIEELGKSK